MTIAYNNHDIDDGFNAGFFSIEKLRELPFIDRIVADFEKEHPAAMTTGSKFMPSRET